MKFLEDLEGFVSGKVDILKNFLILLKLETKLAGLSIFPLLVTVCLLFAVLISWWLSFLMMLGYGTLILTGSPWGMILTLIVMNSACIFFIFKYLLFNLKNMSFEKTRAFFATSEHDYVQSETKIDCKNQ